MPLGLLPADPPPATPDRKLTLHPAETAPGTSSQTPSINPETVQTTAVAPAPAATSSPRTVAAPTTAQPATVAAQVAPTLVTLAKSVNGSQQMTIRLNPVELGMVQVRIERAASGLTQVEITADKPETLQALRRDQPALHHTLDEAGIPAAGRTVTFHTVQPTPASSASSGSGHGTGQQNLAGRANTGGTNPDGSAGQGKGGYPARESNRWFSGRPSLPLPNELNATTPSDAQTYRVGLDITA